MFRAFLNLLVRAGSEGAPPQASQLISFQWEILYSRLVSPVYLLTSRESVGLRKPHPAQQVGVAGVGANPVPERVYC